MKKYTHLVLALVLVCVICVFAVSCDNSDSNNMHYNIVLAEYVDGGVVEIHDQYFDGHDVTIKRDGFLKIWFCETWYPCKIEKVNIYNNDELLYTLPWNDYAFNHATTPVMNSYFYIFSTANIKFDIYDELKIEIISNTYISGKTYNWKETQESDFVLATYTVEIN